MSILASQPNKQCEYCGETIRGRADKKFCSSECRNGYHNHFASLNDAFMRQVNKALRKNRRILSELNPDGKTSVHVDRLNDRGFNFRYFTHLYTTKDGKEYRFCYEFGYMEFKPDWFVLVKRDQER